MADFDYNLCGSPDGINFGWIPFAARTQEQNDAHDYALGTMPTFSIVGSAAKDEKKYDLAEFAKKANKGQHFRPFFQKTGSCVGNGGGLAVWYTSAVEIVKNGDPGTPVLPFYLLPYGRSRFYCGMRGRGEGSLGSAFAKAIRDDGILPADLQGLPKWEDKDGITWNEAAEMEWSDGERVPRDLAEQARKYPIGQTALIKDTDYMRQALQNYYACTIASGWGGEMSPRAQGTPAVLVNRKVQVWNHQMMVDAWWEHPQLGELFRIRNSWGTKAHPQPPDDSPLCSFWVSAKEMDFICRTGEVYAFSQFKEFYAQDLSYLLG